jgi:predicted P-loop ATPase
MIRVPVTIFDNIGGKTMTTVDMNVEELGDMATSNKASNKEGLPLFVLGRFGTTRTPDGSLRHDRNLLARTGWCVDHDAGTMSFDEAKARLEGAGLCAFGYTTARHTPTTPRWRVAGPFSKEIPAAELPRMMARINGLLGGSAAAESAKLTQSWFIGRVDGVPFDAFHTIDDEYLDEAGELDSSAIPIQSGTAPKPKPGKKTAPDYGALSRDELRDLILNRQHDFGPGNELLRRDAYDEVPQADAETSLRDIYDKIPPAQQDRAWSKARSSVSRWAQHVYARVAKRKGRFFSSVVGHFAEDERWRLSIRFNRFTQQIEVCDPFPPPGGQPVGAYRSLRDPVDILEAMMAIQEEGFAKAGKTTVTDAVVVVAEKRAYHPVQEWLRGLPWDGVERINRLFLDYFPGELPPETEPQARDDVTSYLEKTAECFLVGAVKRILEPGVKVDCLPCLVSPQGWNKSRGLAALVPNPEWFSDDLSTNVTDRDAKESLCGKWIIELSEFPHFRRDIDRVKAFFSRQTDRYRRAYGRLNTDHKRQCVFIASANELELIDITGNRRVWPVPIAKPIDVAAIERDRDQLWAEAVHWLDQGFAWWLPPGIEAIAGEMQDAFVEADEWDGLILDFLDRRFPVKPDKTRDRFTRRQVVEGLGFSYVDPGEPRFPKAADEKRVERRLRRLGFRPDPRRPRSPGGGKRERFWIVEKP